MSLFEAVVLGAVQGLTEFIPISSSGHLVLVPEAAGWDEPGLAFVVLLHTASLIALLIYFRAEVGALVGGLLGRDSAMRRLLALLVIGSVPAGVAGIALARFFEESFEDADASAIQLVVTAVILVAAEQALRFHERRLQRHRRELRRIDDLGAPDATVIGIAQAISILPGISRSGATIGAGLGLALRRDDAARFAFLLAIPALLGATLVEVPDLGASSVGSGAAVGGFAASLLSSYFAIAGLIRYLKSNTLYPFALYCVVAGVAFYVLV